MNKTIEANKITLEEYQQKYSNPENIVAAKTFLFMLAAVIGVVIAACLFFVVLRLFDMNQVAGYLGTFFAIIIFFFIYVVPVVKLKNTKSFLTNPSGLKARQAQKYNKRLREDIADKMIDVTAKTDEVGWYSEHLVGKLAIARQTGNDTELKSVLTKIYQTDVRSAANKMIRTSAVRVGIATAVSQSEVIDTLFVVVSELNLIKNIVFLYGYRPTDTQMVKIYKNVLANALIAYGVSSTTAGMGKTFGNGLANMIDKASQSSSALTSAIGAIVGGIAGTALESTMQLIVNSTLTMVVGHQTKKYLIKEYHLQEILDNVELMDSDEEEAKMLESIRDELKKKAPKKTKNQKNKLATSEF